MVLETGRPIAEVARDLQINEGTLGNWVNTWRRDNPEPDQPLNPVAAQLLVSWFHRGRVRSEAPFAALASAAPLEASSGQRKRHRLNRGGDRDLNRALHTVAITRMRCHPESVAYELKRRGEGKTHKDIRRGLKRTIARPLYRCIQAATAPIDDKRIAAPRAA